MGMLNSVCLSISENEADGREADENLVLCIRKKYLSHLKKTFVTLDREKTYERIF